MTGIRANLAMHDRILAHPVLLAAGSYDTGFLERHRAELLAASPADAGRTPRRVAVALAVAAARADKAQALEPSCSPPADRPRSLRGSPTTEAARGEGPRGAYAKRRVR